MATNNTGDNSILNAALAYAVRGWAVIPLIGKKPLVPHGYKDGTKDPTPLCQYEWDTLPLFN
jgi:hypothetical protein